MRFKRNINLMHECVGPDAAMPPARVELRRWMLGNRLLFRSAGSNPVIPPAYRFLIEEVLDAVARQTAMKLSYELLVFAAVAKNTERIVRPD